MPLVLALRDYIANPHIGADMPRMALVLGCALALVGAGQPLPF